MLVRHQAGAEDGGGKPIGSKIASYGERNFKRVLAVPGMIRSRRKVEAIIHNANRFLALQPSNATKKA